VQPGAQLLAIVPLDQVWVDANLKEDQLRHLRIGQPVELLSDLYGKSIRFDGRVAGLGAGTGSVFAALPAQNATGNWIKVVQRLPVRIALDPKQLEQHPLRIGLSMRVTVSTRDRSGASLAAAPQPTPRYVAPATDAVLAQADRAISTIISANSGRVSTAAEPQPVRPRA